MDLDIARRDGGFTVGEESDPPAVGRNFVSLARRVAAQHAALGVPFGEACGEGAFGVLLDQVLHTDDSRVIVRMQIDAENAGDQDAVAELQAAQFHIPDHLVDDDLPVDTGLRLHGSAVRHADQSLFSARHAYPATAPRPCQPGFRVDAERTFRRYTGSWVSAIVYAHALRRKCGKYRTVGDLAPVGAGGGGG